MAGAGIFVVGGVLLVIAALGYVIPIAGEEGYSLPQVVGLCNSGMGQLGQAFSGDIVKACSDYNVMIIGVYGSGVLGVILMIVGAVKPESSKKDKTDMNSLEILKERYAKGEITKDEFDKIKKDLEWNL